MELAARERRDARAQAELMIIRSLARRRLVTRDGLTKHAGDARELAAAG
jgi:hypothetical protein